MLRDYQQRAIDQLYAWFANGNKGNPCQVLSGFAVLCAQVRQLAYLVGAPLWQKLCAGQKRH